MSVHNKQGFTLFELMVALTLIAMISGMLYTALSQSRTAAASIERTTSIYMRTIVAQRQLFRDIAGAFIPLSILEPKKEKSKEAETDQDKSSDPEKKPASSEKKSDKSSEKDSIAQAAELKKQLAQTFNSTAENKLFKQLILISSNPLEVYWSKSAGRPRPRIENITYSLELDKGPSTNTTPSYSLKRITSYKKNDKGEAITQPHTLISGIKNMTVQYTALIEEKKEEDAAQKGVQTTPDSGVSADKKKEEKKVIAQIFDDWNVQALDDKDVRLQKKLPDYATVILELWAPTKKTSETFTFVIPIAWQEIKHTKPQQSTQPQNKKPAQKDVAKKPSPQRTGAQAKE